MVRISWDIKAKLGLDLVHSYSKSHSDINGEYSVSYENADFTGTHKLIRVIICAESRKECEYLFEQEKAQGKLKEDISRGNVGEICYTLDTVDIETLVKIEENLHELMNVCGGILNGCEHINTAWCEIYKYLKEIGFYKD